MNNECKNYIHKYKCDTYNENSDACKNCEMRVDNPIVFTISKFSGEKFDCKITTPDARAIEDSQTLCYSVSVLRFMKVLSEKYNNKGFAVVFEAN